MFIIKYYRLNAIFRNTIFFTNLISNCYKIIINKLINRLAVNIKITLKKVRSFNKKMILKIILFSFLN